MKKVTIIAGLLGFFLFALGLLFPLAFVEEKLNLSVDMIESIETTQMVVLTVAVILLSIGIITTIKSKGYKFWIGFILCLIAPLGWLITLFLHDKQLSQEVNATASTRKLLWVSLIILGICGVVFFSARPHQITSDEVESLKPTYSWLVEMGGSIGNKKNFTADEFLALTGLDYSVRHFANAANYRDGRVNTPWDNRGISLHDSAISDDDLSRLKIFKFLRRLDLDNTTISDAGLVHLYDLKGLRMISLKNTSVSDVGVEKLKASLPACEIIVK